MSCEPRGYYTTNWKAHNGFYCDYAAGGVLARCPAGYACPDLGSSAARTGLGRAIPCPNFQEFKEVGWGLRLFCDVGSDAVSFCPDGFVCPRGSCSTSTRRDPENLGRTLT